MKISIVTLSFNQAEFLEQAICSVINQSYQDIEYIVVDPGSTDGSRDIIEHYKSKISHIILEPDNGPADGLNKGFGHAKGNIMGFLNADDVLEGGSLSSVVRYFKTNPCVDVVSGNSWVIDENGNKRRRFFSDKFSLWFAAYGASFLSQASTFFRSEKFRQIGGFNVENHVSWDGELFLDMALIGARFARVEEIWSRFRVYDMSISGSGKLRSLNETTQARLFTKVTGRDQNFFDRYLMQGAKLLRKILHPHDTFERLIHGPIVGQGPSKDVLRLPS